MKDNLLARVLSDVKVAHLGILSLLLVSCASQQVSESIADLSAIEGQRFAHEVAAQSPFETQEIRWSEATALMELRNSAFRNASRTYHLAREEHSKTNEVTNQLKDVLIESLDDTFNADALAKSLQNPVSQLPKQFATLTKVKDLSHRIERKEWEKANEVVEAELTMRRERVKLHRLLQTGGLIDAELARLRGVTWPDAEADSKWHAAMVDWRAHLLAARQQWLEAVRDLYDAEYHDVKFIADAPGLPRYEDVEQPDLSDGQRWCQLPRKRELVELLNKAHQQRKPSVPGATAVTDKLADIVGMETPAATTYRHEGSLRQEVRGLIKNWRELKKTQKKANRLEENMADQPVQSASDAVAWKKYFDLRRAEIDHAAAIWALDESCWQDSL